MFCNGFKGFPGQVQPVERCVMPFQRGHDADRLRIVIEAAIRCHQCVQRVFAGVAERRMPKIMGQRHGLGQFLIQPQRARNGPGHLRHLDGMGQARTIIVAFVFNENLGLVFQPPKRAGVNDPVPVPLKAGAKVAFFFRYEPSPAQSRVRSIGGTHMSPPVLVACPSAFYIVR